jgi:uncharacterized membrane protein YeaQ/YmgE (transglycosylase-associated protein family)
VTSASRCDPRPPFRQRYIVALDCNPAFIGRNQTAEVCSSFSPVFDITPNMVPHYWIDLHHKKKIALFILAAALLAEFWYILPDELKTTFNRGSRGSGSLPAMMVMGWLGGWFTLLFVRGEDTNVITPFAFQSLICAIAGAMIAVALAIAGFFSIAFVV